jgi:hypothetical protein
MKPYRISFLSGKRRFVDVDAETLDEAMEKAIDSLQVTDDTAIGDFEFELIATSR